MTSLSKTMVGTSKEDSEYDFIPDLPSGDLDHYRKQAKFNWKHLKVTLEGSAENLKLKYHIWNTLEADPFFVHPAVTPTVDEQKRQTAILMDRIKKHNFSPSHRLFKKCYPEMIQHMLISCEAYISYNINISVKTAIGIYAIASTLLSLGTERHKPMFEAVWNRKILSALALTEVAHGSNTKNMQTTSTYDPETQEFVINTPDFKAAKCWVGNLGKTCTVSLVFAQLYTADGSCHGLHGFVVHVRDPNTMLPYPSVIVGDIGEKTGLNGVDNGFIMFQNHRVPRESLLNRIGDVTPKGEYQRSFSKPGEVLGAVLQNLTLVRVGIINNCAYILGNSITIALRYAAQRKQFGEPGEEEMPILEYELHQWRLFPYLAAAVVFKIFSKIFAKIYLDKIFKYQEVDRMSEMVAEMHSIVSACKPLLTWTAHQSTQEAREACGGHGYLKASRLGDLRDDFDPFLTFEGDNHVLGQQSSNWMLRQWDECHHQNNPVSSPLGSISFIKNASNILKTSFSARGAASVGYVRFTLSAYEWLICWLLKTTDSRLKQKLANGETKFAARCSSQVYRSSVLTRAYSEYVVLKYCSQKISTVDQSLQPVLSNLLILYGLTSLDKHLVLLYQGGYSSDSSLVDMVREGILEYCARVKPDAIAIVDALAPPDFILNSVLGNSDGKLYQHLQREFFSYPGAMERPHWWRDINSKL